MSFFSWRKKNILNDMHQTCILDRYIILGEHYFKKQKKKEEEEKNTNFLYYIYYTFFSLVKKLMIHF